jgi:hypothetical protein
MLAGTPTRAWVNYHVPKTLLGQAQHEMYLSWKFNRLFSPCVRDKVVLPVQCFEGARTMEES